MMAIDEKRGCPIGVFDSGVGGISVLQELIKVMPNENYIYLGDSKHAPYGTKPLEEVRSLSFRNAEDLLAQGAKGLVVACNTATSAAVRLMRGKYPQLPIVGIEPALKPAALEKEHPRVLVMATPMTVQQDKFKQLMARYADKAEIYPLPCPGLMEFVEAGDLDSEQLHDFLQQLLAPYLDKHLDSVVLGCTHYPFARKMIRRIVGDSVTIFDGGEGTAREMRRRLAAADLLNPATEPGWVKFENSVSTEAELQLCRRLLKQEI
ncbi:MAG: glutamate racemase [bacterium]|nr:glutamate racemase [bacterium]MDY4100621.1 glutamate racemase [Lachnospiraceae bacterium]